MQGDRVGMAVDVEDMTCTYGVVASGAGRGVGAVVRRGVVEVSEVTPAGVPSRMVRFLVNGGWRWSQQPVPREGSSETWGHIGHPLREDPET
ncbi:hypothetical protein ABZ027_40480 [Streptomyces sp. NPDC006332]|uniref:hypothetical protein n=1 Tax=Streptomyces sp. NPDC006332 TaxID=3155456 RepID=UPI0033BAAB2B